MKIRQFDIWLADLSPAMDTEAGKTRPVVIVQTDLLNDFHPSTLICPVTAKVKSEVKILRVHLDKNRLTGKSDVLVDQIRAIDNRRFLRRLGKLTAQQRRLLKENLQVVLDI